MQMKSINKNGSPWIAVLLFFACIIAPSGRAESLPESLTFCADPDWMPFEGIINGRHTGIAHDYATLFERLTGIRLVLQPTASWEETTRHLQSGECDLTLLLNRSEHRETYLAFSLPYFFAPNVLVTDKSTPFIQDLVSVGNKRLGVVRGYRLAEEIPLYYPELTVIKFDSESEGLSGLEQGKVDVYVGSLFSVNAKLRQLGFDDLRINGWISRQDELRIGFAKQNAYLLPVFNRAIEAISTKQHNEIFNRWSTVRLVSETDYRLLYAVSALALLVVSALLWRTYVAAKITAATSAKNAELENIRAELLSANKNLEYLSLHDSLTGLFNAYYFKSVLSNHIQHSHNDGGEDFLLLFEPGDIKRVNEQGGHLTADKTLRSVAKLLSGVLPPEAILARWYGADFIVLWPDTSRSEVYKLQTTLKATVERAVVSSGHDFSLRVGYTSFEKGDSIDSWISRVEKQLPEC